MTVTPPMIDPTKPVSGNFKGSFAGFVAMGATGWLAKKGIITKCASFFCVPDAIDGVKDVMFSCGDAEFYTAIFFVATIGTGVNYLVTRNAQIANLKKWWDRIPTTEATFPGDAEKAEKPKSVGMENGNFNKP